MNPTGSAVRIGASDSCRPGLPAADFTRMKVRADRSSCIGAGVCPIHAPDVFTVGEDGIVAILRDEVDASDGDALEAIGDAVAYCPAQALALEVDAGR